MGRDSDDSFSSKSARDRSKDDRQLVIIPADNVPAYLVREQDNQRDAHATLNGRAMMAIVAIGP